MNSFKYTAVALAIASIASLSACGGGGGGSSPTPPPPASCTNNATNPPACDNQPKDAAGTVAVTPSDTAPAVKRDIASLTLTVTPTATSGSALSIEVLGYSCNGVSIVADLSKGTLSPSKALTLVPTTLPAYGDTCIAQGTATFAGANGGKQATVSWKTTFTVEQAPKLTYTDKVYALWTFQYPYSVTKNTDGTWTVAKVKNVSKYQTGVSPLGNCAMYKTPLTSGTILANCTVAVDTVRRNFALNPITQELDEYLGQAPAASDPGWISNQPFDPSTPTWGPKTQVADGWYHTSNTVTWTLLFTDKTGKTVTVKEGDYTVDRDIASLFTYNNK